MDSVTQAVLGAAIGEATLGRQIGKRGAVLGAVVATLPDLDVLFYPFLSPLQKISFHRGYSHSILFSIVGALLLVWLFKKLNWTKQVTSLKLFWFSWLALFTHMLLDAFTSYGTQLFLPFSDYRVSFDSIGIIDPAYTLLLLAGLIVCLFVTRISMEKRRRFNYAGLVLSSLYLVFTLFNKQYVTAQVAQQLEGNGITYNQLLTVPVQANNFTWYGAAKTDDGLYLGRYEEFRTETIQFEYFPTNDSLLQGLDEEMVDRLTWFAQNYYVVAEEAGNIRLYNLQCDMQGVRHFGDYKVPTAFYFEIDTTNKLSVGMHEAEENTSNKR